MSRSPGKHGDHDCRPLDSSVVVDAGARQDTLSPSTHLCDGEDDTVVGGANESAGPLSDERSAIGDARRRPRRNRPRATPKSRRVHTQSSASSSATSRSRSQDSFLSATQTSSKQRGGASRGQKHSTKVDSMETPLSLAAPNVQEMLSMFGSLDAADFTLDDRVLDPTTLKTTKSQAMVLIAQLRGKISDLKHRAEHVMDKALLPYQVRRAAHEKEAIDKNISLSTHYLKQLTGIKKRISFMLKLRAKVLRETQTTIRQEIETLYEEKEKNDELIRRGFIDRIHLLRRYWPWRQLLELGDNKVGANFEEELMRGPRYRNVGLQNNVEYEFIKSQIHWLEAYRDREDVFRREIMRLDGLVDDLNDINGLIESAITCTVCGLLFEEPVLFWPCGHCFCCLCFDSLAIAPGLFRCSVCGSLGSEGYLHNIIVSDTVAKWMFKDSGYSNLVQPVTDMYTYLTQFQHNHIEERIKNLRQIIFEQKANKFVADNRHEITISYRQY